MSYYCNILLTKVFIKEFRILACLFYYRTYTSHFPANIRGCVILNLISHKWNTARLRVYWWGDQRNTEYSNNSIYIFCRAFSFFTAVIFTYRVSKKSVISGVWCKIDLFCATHLYGIFHLYGTPMAQKKSANFFFFQNQKFRKEKSVHILFLSNSKIC